MKTIFVIALVGLLIANVCIDVTQAAIARGKFSNPDHPGKCVIDSNTILSPGQSGKAPNNPCAGVTCLDDGYAEIRTCGAEAPPKGCKLRDFVDTNRPYPSCCERSYDCTKYV